MLEGRKSRAAEGTSLFYLDFWCRLVIDQLAGMCKALVLPSSVKQTWFPPLRPDWPFVVFVHI